MDKISIKKLRKMKYFIDATKAIIEAEGIEKVTIRKIAEKAGYNSATIYNYFEDLNHLIFFTKIDYLERYTNRLTQELTLEANALERYCEIWRIFANEAFQNPKIFYDLFFSKYSHDLSNALTIYYQIYPDKIKDYDERLSAMLNENDIFKRNYTLLEGCLEEQLILEKNIKEINEMSVILFRGLLNEYIENNLNDPSLYTSKYLYLLKSILNHFN